MIFGNSGSGKSTIAKKFCFKSKLAYRYRFKIGLLRRDFKEVVGQLVRIPFGILGSCIGIVPTGNTGGSNVSMFAKMDIPKDIEKYFSKSE